MNTAISHRRRQRRGATTVEAAFVLPILFLLIFAGWEFARINVIRNTMDNAAYSGARASMLPGTNTTKIETAVNEVLDAVGIAGGTVNVSPTAIVTTTEQVTVDVTVPVAGNSLGVAKFFTSGNLTASCTLSRELQPGNF